MKVAINIGCRSSLLWVFIVITLEIDFLLGNANIKNNRKDKAEEQKKKVTEILSDDESILYVTQQPTQTPRAEFMTITPSSDNINFCKCGLASSASGKIVGGTPVNEHNFWPWFAALVRADRLSKVHCGASLISRRHLLTAAHCLLPMIQVGLRNFKVRLGFNQLLERNTTANESSAYEEKQDRFDVSIESVTIHPLYEQLLPYHYDIGVVKLSHEISCTNRVRPICLPSADYSDQMYANLTALTAGFGRTAINANQSSILQQIHLKLILMNECKQAYSRLPFRVPELLDNMLCAWSKGKDTCVGDSGGPLFLWRMASNVTALGERKTSNYFEQVGITSFGIGCANDMFPGVYTRVDKFLPWLNVVINYYD